MLKSKSNLEDKEYTERTIRDEVDQEKKGKNVWKDGRQRIVEWRAKIAHSNSGDHGGECLETEGNRRIMEIACIEYREESREIGGIEARIEKSNGD